MLLCSAAYFLALRLIRFVRRPWHFHLPTKTLRSNVGSRRRAAVELPRWRGGDALPAHLRSLPACSGRLPIPSQRNMAVSLYHLRRLPVILL